MLAPGAVSNLMAGFALQVVIVAGVLNLQRKRHVLHFIGPTFFELVNVCSRAEPKPSVKAIHAQNSPVLFPGRSFWPTEKSK
jgi:hypothetical protein